ncbi:MAG: hypothetical protein ACPGNV_15925 [Mangrovicoccus sp.]
MLEIKRLNWSLWLIIFLALPITAFANNGICFGEATPSKKVIVTVCESTRYKTAACVDICFSKKWYIENSQNRDDKAPKMVRYLMMSVSGGRVGWTETSRYMSKKNTITFPERKWPSTHSDLEIGGRIWSNTSYWVFDVRNVFQPKVGVSMSFD